MFDKEIGSRAEVMHGHARMTSGKLMKKDLKYSKSGEIVSKKKSARAKKSSPLVKMGYIKLAKKSKGGVFKPMKKM